MNRLDKRIKRDRNRVCKMIKKLFKARDMASIHLSKPLRMTTLLEYFSNSGTNELHLSKTDLAYLIVNKEKVIRGIRPPKPPSRPVTAKK